MTWATMLATHLVIRRKGKSIASSDYLAAVYLTVREVLRTSCKHPALLDNLIRTACSIPDPPWFYWIEFYAALRKDSLRRGVVVPCSKEVASLLSEAEHLASTQTHRAGMAEVKVSDFLAAAVAQDTQLASELRQCEINFKKLRKSIDP
jgi:hypothetical protein